MRIIKKKVTMQGGSDGNPLKLLVSKKIHGAKNCQAGVLALSPGERLPSTGLASHLAEEVYFIQSGTLRLEMGDGEEILHSGDIVFVPAYESHANTNISDEIARIVWFVTPDAVPED